MKRLLCVAAALTSLPAQAQDRATTVSIESGVLRGAAVADIASFKGVPFAAAPTGELRWRAPQPALHWKGERDATRFGSICPQTDFPGGAAIVGVLRSEDCLFLNVWAPAAGIGKRAVLPVLVSIHGGGMVNGSGSDAVFDGAALANRGLVVVTFNYRLGRLGFFRHPAIDAEAAKAGEATGNFAFMDQIAALEWVKANIARFGGDPVRVTIAGESAGGVSVLAMMTSPRAKGLFSAAIAQSAVPRFDFVAGPDAEKAGIAFAASAGLSGADAKALRDIPVATLLKGAEFFSQDRKTYSGPMVDGTVIVHSLMPAFVAGQQARVPMIVGTTGRELGG
jgi:para-nitrobenzyl esterase